MNMSSSALPQRAFNRETVTSAATDPEQCARANKNGKKINTSAAIRLIVLAMSIFNGKVRKRNKMERTST